MVGTYGFNVDQYPDNLDPSGPVDRFHDIAFDAQYQYVTDAHRLSAQVAWIRERQNWDATFPQGGTSNATDTLNTFHLKGTYYYDRIYGVNVGYFSSHGDVDDVLYNTGDPIVGSAAGSPNSSGYVLELNYLPKRDIRLVAQYTGYTKFNGASSNYDGNGRNARDNNTLYLLLWMMF